MQNNNDDLTATIDSAKNEDHSMNSPPTATLLINFASFVTAIITAFSYIMLLGYTSKYSIPFPFGFFPYLLFFGICIFVTVFYLSVFALTPPIIMNVAASQKEYQDLLQLSANGGLLRIPKIPDSIRQLFNLYAAAVTVEIYWILNTIFEHFDNRNFLITVLLLLFLLWILQLMRVKKYVYDYNGLSMSDKKTKHQIFILFSIFTFFVMFFNIMWYVSMLLIISGIVQVVGYVADYEQQIVLSVLIGLILIQCLLAWVTLQASRSGAATITLTGMLAIILCLLLVYPGGTIFMRGALSAHNLGGGVIATLSIRGDACQHLNFLIEHATEIVLEKVCTTKPVAVLLNVGDTVYLGEAPSAAPESDVKQPTDGEDSNRTLDRREKVWSVDRSSVIGMEFQSRGESKWLALPDRES